VRDLGAQLRGPDHLSRKRGGKYRSTGRYALVEEEARGWQRPLTRRLLGDETASPRPQHGLQWMPLRCRSWLRMGTETGCCGYSVGAVEGGGGTATATHKILSRMTWPGENCSPTTICDRWSHPNCDSLPETMAANVPVTALRLHALPAGFSTTALLPVSSRVRHRLLPFAMAVMLGGIPATVRTPVAGVELDAIAALETASYAADEAASPQALAQRLKVAPELFLAAYDSVGTLLAFVCGTRSALQLTAESMSTHDPDGPLVCIHSVVTRPDARGRGVAVQLVREYLSALPLHTEVALIARAHHVPLYQGAGFVSLGPSAVEHGAGVWMEMRMETGGPADKVA